MPPVRRYWPLYLVISCVLIAGGVLAVQLDVLKARPNVQVLAAGVAMALFSLIATVWSQWHAARTQHTLNALQVLRTDREYLIAATIMRRHVRLGADLSEEALAALLTERTITPPGDTGETAPDFAPGFTDAVDFVLNQNEFLAAGVREGAMDERLLQATQRGVVLGLGKTLAPYIRATRADNPRIWENLVCLFHRFARNDLQFSGIDLGVVPNRLLHPMHGYPHTVLYPDHPAPWPWNRPGGGW